MKRPPLLAVALAFAVGCTTSSPAPRARPTTGSAPATTTPAATPTKASPTASPSPPSFGGADVTWPRTGESTPPPPALGAVETVRVARTSDGRTLAARLTLPRVGGSDSAPMVLTPCGRRAVLSSKDVKFVAPSKPGRKKSVKDVVVLVDPGHGGPHELGALAPNGDREKERNLQIGLELHRLLHERGMATVVMTRERDFEATLEFRATLADALRADAAISVHLNSSPDGPRPTPGTETFGSTADGVGRRFAGLVYEHLRRYTQTLPGPFVGDRDAGAKYRVGRDGRDYYGLLRRAHVPFVISEALYISHAPEAALVAKPEVRLGLARALADAVVAFTTTNEHGSGWVRPYPRPPDPAGGKRHTCVDPAR